MSSPTLGAREDRRFRVVFLAIAIVVTSLLVTTSTHAHVSEEDVNINEGEST